MDQQASKQQIVDRIKQAENILVSVSANPTIDQLAACIGLTLMFNKIENKSATAVYSGKTPPVMEFLAPEKTLEPNTDSLRDFIISLDKAKADKLRYKVEDQVVRIFITPYKTKLSDKDLAFSEGDFNVDVIVTLGVADRAHLDTAITAHGRILHDATVIAIAAGQGKVPDLGQINWQDPSASSLSEMLVSLSEAFGTGLIDNQIATAFLTGIVSETERFSNKKTSPKVMTMSAQLMAAGANQQLVVSKLQPPPPPPPPPAAPAKPAPTPATPPKPNPAPQPQPKKAAPPPPKPPEPPKPAQPPQKPKIEPPKIEVPPLDITSLDTGLLTVAHESSEADGGEVEINTKEIHIDKQGNLKLMDESGNKSAEPSEPPKPDPKPSDNQKKETKENKADKGNKEKPKEEAPKPAAPPPPPPPPPIPKTPDIPPPLPNPTPPPPPTFGTPVAQQAGPPPPPIAPLGVDLPPLPPPPPPPAIKKDIHAVLNDSAPPPAANASAHAPDKSPSENHHTLLDPLSKGPGGAAFSADTLESGAPGVGNVDPTNSAPSNGHSEFSMHQKIIKPPEEEQPLSPVEQLLAAQNTDNDAANNNPANDSLTPDSARQAVENAFASAPFNPDLNPTAASGALPGPEIHTPPESQNGAPGLNLTENQGPPPTAPPPMPPPIGPLPPPTL
jgi:hypothetical protein